MSPINLFRGAVILNSAILFSYELDLLQNICSVLLALRRLFDLFFDPGIGSGDAVFEKEPGSPAG
jgi:hypothetical protein